MSFFIGNCCLKINSFICGANESTLDKKKRKFKVRQHESIVNKTSLTNKSVDRATLTPINSFHQHNVNVTSPRHTLQQSNSTIKSFGECTDIDSRQRVKNVPLSSLSSSIDHRLSQRSSIVSNGILIKNVTLHRQHPNERLGLTLCYAIASECTTNIYIQQIDQESIAGHQGELRNGDQIIKINNQHVTSRDEAIKLVNGTCLIHLQIVRFEPSDLNLPVMQSKHLTEDDSGVTLTCHTDLEIANDWMNQQTFMDEFNILSKSCASLSLSNLNSCSNCRRLRSCSRQFQYRRCLSLNDLRPCSLTLEQNNFTNHLIRSQSLLDIATDNEQIILKPLPFRHSQRQQRQEQRTRRTPMIEGYRDDDSDSGLACGRSRSNDSRQPRHIQNQWTVKYTRRRYREQCLKAQYQTTDDEPMSELKQGRYWTRQQRKEHLAKAKQYRQRAKFFQQSPTTPLANSATEDFNLLNRIFLRENEQELKRKPHLAYKYGQESSMERDRLRKMIQQYYFRRIRSQSATTVSVSSTFDQSSVVIL